MKKVWSVLLICAMMLVACGGDDDGSDVTVGEGEAVDLGQTFTQDDFSVQHPDGWVVEYDLLEGVTLATSQAALDAFNASPEPSFEGIPGGSTIIDIAALPFPAERGTVADVFAGIADSDGGPLSAGEPSEVGIGQYAGVRAPLAFADDAGTGAGLLYLLRSDDARILLGITIATGDLNTRLVEDIIASIQLPPG